MEVLIGLMLVSMVVVLLFSWKWFGSLRLAFIIMLVVGKIFAGVLMAYGFDKAVFSLYIFNKLRGTYGVYVVTADQLIIISFIITLLSVLMWPYIRPHLPEPIRHAELISRSEGER